ncbi:MAG: T9SS type A sorting domain-containing protein [Bacteroidetes bacterium]|nr:T9SS type A sorting domain-containing protein [Bacteroidota bacterium]
MKNFFLCLIMLLAFGSAKSQVVCILCFDQNDSISDNVTNLLLNGGFESSNCGGLGYFCPNSSFYNCDLTNWTCTGGGTNTYAHNIDNTFSMVIEGTQAAYLGNFYCNACSNVTNDTSCLSDSACTMNPLPPGFPTNTVQQGGSTGVSLSQTVNGLTPGNTYVLEFWAGGEGSSWPNRGLFGVDVGFGDTLLRCKQTRSFSTDIGTRYLVEFMATSASHTIKFTNWGHICQDCTELIIDDVRLYPLTDLSPSVSPCLGINPIALFSAPNHICPGTCTSFNNLSLNCFSFLWSFPGANPSVSTDINPTNICYNSPGTYAVSLVGSNATTSDTLTLNNYITVYPYPAAQGIAQSGDTLFANAGAVSYQWYYNGGIISGATASYYVASASGDYNVVATDNNGCEVEAVIFNVFAGIAPTQFEGEGVYLYPNPVHDNLSIHKLKITSGSIVSISVYNMTGQRVIEHQSDVYNSKYGIALDVSVLSAGLYYVGISGVENVFYARFIKN